MLVHPSLTHVNSSVRSVLWHFVYEHVNPYEVYERGIQQQPTTLLVGGSAKGLFTTATIAKSVQQPPSSLPKHLFFTSNFPSSSFPHGDVCLTVLKTSFQPCI
mmetsp:Transcript_26422/g.43267  ORF Transcript_26422/g.43267 Transcript_26422/m.43267 type:complete len:103 (+) Transcript_26422:636-944(+)